MARKSSRLVDSLFLPTVRDVLGATVTQPDREWYLSDLAAHLHVGPSSLQRTLAKLIDAGILARRKDGNRVYYRADQECPILNELSSIMVKTAGIADLIREALVPLSTQITTAFVHGSIAEGREHSESDIDVIIVGDVPGMLLAARLRALREALGRDVNFSRYSVQEFRSKVAVGQHFLSNVLGKPRIFLIGNEHVLETIIGGQANRGRAHEQAGAR